MLNSTENILAHLNVHLTMLSATVASASLIHTKKLKGVLVKASFDAVTVGAVTFGSTLLALGFVNFDESIRIAAITSMVQGGLSFITEIKKNEREILTTKRR